MLRTCRSLVPAAIVVCLLAAVRPAAASTTSTTFVSTTTTSTTVETTSTSTTVLVTTTSTTEPSTTSTSVTTTTSTSTSSTTTTSTSTTSTTSTSLQVCQCDDIPFMASRVAKLASGSTVNADLAVNDSFGSVTLAPGATMANGTTLTADRVKLASGSSVFDVHANELLAAGGSTVAGTWATPLTVPLLTPYCELPILACGTGTLQIDGTEAPLASGNYGSITIGDGATLVLDDDGPYRFCEVRIANGGTMLFTHQVEVDVTGNVLVGTDSSIRTGGGAPLRLRVGGTKVLLGRNALITAAIIAPHAKVKVKKDSVIEGCVCARVIKAAKNASLSCAGDSPSGAFLD